jgi:phenol 2-monooxygenase (NADPH)
VRFYIELPAGTKVSDVTLESLQAHALRVFQPYSMEFAETAWWSAYSIGQRHADFFHKDYRVFLTGDACHTHSPKAGQGMNVSLQDGHNIGWKLGMVLNGLAKPSLLETYVTEREKTAVELIEFDRGFTRLFSSKYRAENGITPEFFAEQFVKAGRYTAGQAVLYNGSDIVGAGEGDAALATKVTVGMRFPSAQVVRFGDAKAMQLVKALPADGQWYIVVFAGDLAKPEATERLRKVGRPFPPFMVWMYADLQQAADTLHGIAQSFTPSSADPDSVLDRVLVISSDRKKIEQEQIPEFFTPVTGKWKMKCKFMDYQNGKRADDNTGIALMKTFADDESYNSGHGHAYKEYGVEPEKGAVVVVRPDHCEFPSQHEGRWTELTCIRCCQGPED